MRVITIECCAECPFFELRVFSCGCTHRKGPKIIKDAEVVDDNCPLTDIENKLRDRVRKEAKNFYESY